MTAATTRHRLDPGSNAFRVLAMSAGFEPGMRGGGPIRSVAAIVDTISETTDLWLITRDRDAGNAGPYPGLSGRWISRGRSRVFYLNIRKPRQWRRLWHKLRAESFDLLYVNSLWEPTFAIVPIALVKLRVIHARRVLLAPRGELSPGALSLKSYKKRLFLKLWGPLLQSMNVVWHASTDLEAADIRAAFPLAQVEVNQDQVLLPYEPLPILPATDGPPRLVFISRISAKKNLDLVLKGLKHLSKPVALDIYGPLEDAAYWSKCRYYIRQLPANVRVKYMGVLAPSEVRRTFADYDAFVFPTRGENFGHIIAESLSASCPVVCSAATPWTSVLMAGGGAIVRDLTAAGVGEELERIAVMTPAERLERRKAAGDAYRSWRRGHDGSNILERVRIAGLAHARARE